MQSRIANDFVTQVLVGLLGNSFGPCWSIDPIMCAQLWTVHTDKDGNMAAFYSHMVYRQV